MKLLRQLILLTTTLSSFSSLVNSTSMQQLCPINYNLLGLTSMLFVVLSSIIYGISFLLKGETQKKVRTASIGFFLLGVILVILYLQLPMIKHALGIDPKFDANGCQIY